MRLGFTSPSNLRPYPGNPRVNDSAVQAVARSIQEFGFNAPIVVGPGNRICAGHVRWKAAKMLGLRRVPVVRVGELRGLRFKGYHVADNQTASIAEWDTESLARLLSKLKDEGLELPAMGFSDQQLAALLEPAKEIDWERFDERMRVIPASEFVLLPVKVPRKHKNRLHTAIRAYATQNGIAGRDAAVVAGRVLGRLLGVRPWTVSCATK